jgi:hypothetical protein
MVTYHISLVKSIAGSALCVAVLFIIPQTHVFTVDIMTAIGIFPVNNFAAGYTADVSVAIGIEQANIFAEYPV